MRCAPARGPGAAADGRTPPGPRPGVPDSRARAAGEPGRRPARPAPATPAAATPATPAEGLRPAAPTGSGAHEDEPPHGCAAGGCPSEYLLSGPPHTRRATGVGGPPVLRMRGGSRDWGFSVDQPGERGRPTGRSGGGRRTRRAAVSAVVPLRRGRRNEGGPAEAGPPGNVGGRRIPVWLGPGHPAGTDH